MKGRNLEVLNSGDSTIGSTQGEYMTGQVKNLQEIKQTEKEIWCHMFQTFNILNHRDCNALVACLPTKSEFSRLDGAATGCRYSEKWGIRTAVKSPASWEWFI